MENASEGGYQSETKNSNKSGGKYSQNDSGYSSNSISHNSSASGVDSSKFDHSGSSATGSAEYNNSAEINSSNTSAESPSEEDQNKSSDDICEDIFRSSSAIQKMIYSSNLAALSQYVKASGTNKESVKKIRSMPTVSTESKQKLLEDFLNENEGDNLQTSGFSMVVWLREMTIMHSSPSIERHLQYPLDMVIGRHMFDLISPQDKMTFTKEVSKVLKSLSEGTSQNSSTQFYCRLREHKNIKKFGFDIRNKKTVYKTFKLRVSFKNYSIESNEPCEMKEVDENTVINNSWFLLYATPVVSAYLADSPPPYRTSFISQHTSTGQISFIESTAVTYLGYLPQDLLGRSVFDFYHPDDLTLIKQDYESVLKEQGHLFLGAPYRFKIQNGCYVILETDWSCFINPWTYRLEFIIGKHRVIKEPSNPDVFAAPDHESEAVLPEINKIVSEIKAMLTHSYIVPVNDEPPRPSNSSGNELNAKQDSCSERGSVVMGEISPHHDCYDSNPSSEVPPSYHQLNYNDTINRFFDSHPRTLSDESRNSGSKVDSRYQSTSTDEEQRSGLPDDSVSIQLTKCMRMKNSPAEVQAKSDASTKDARLTAANLSRHNEMEKQNLVRQHKEWRQKGSKGERSWKSSRSGRSKECHGLKRNHEQSGEDGLRHKCKQQCMDKSRPSCRCLDKTICLNSNNNDFNRGIRNRESVSLWPPFSVAAPYANPGCSSVFYSANSMGSQNLTPYGVFSAFPHAVVYQPAQTDTRIPLITPDQYLLPSGNYPGVLYPVAPPLLLLPHVGLHDVRNPAQESRESQVRNEERGKSQCPDPFSLLRLKKEVRGKTNVDSKLTSQSEYTGEFNLDSRTESSCSFLKLSDSEHIKDSSNIPDLSDNSQMEINQRQQIARVVLKDPFWMENVDFNDNINFCYQKVCKPLQTVLMEDKQALAALKQSDAINEQLERLYVDLKEEGSFSLDGCQDDEAEKMPFWKPINEAAIYEADAILPSLEPTHVDTDQSDGYG